MTTRPAQVNFHLYKNATFSETQVLKDGDGVPLDLTGFSARMQVRRERDDPETVLDLSTDDGEIVLGGVEGTITFTLSAAQTALLQLRDPDGDVWVHDILLSNPATTPPTVDRIYQGRIVVHPGVTREI